jgi:hypothetical protein
MSESTNSANKLHTSIFQIKDTAEEAFSPLEAFQEILDGANIQGCECRPVDVATVIEVLTEYAKQKIEEHIDILLEEYPRDDLEAMATEESKRMAVNEAWGFISEPILHNDDFLLDLAAAFKKNPEELKKAVATIGQTEEPEGPAMTPEEDRAQDLELLREINAMSNPEENEALMKFVGLIHQGMLQRLKAEGKLAGQSETAEQEV